MSACTLFTEQDIGPNLLSIYSLHMISIGKAKCLSLWFGFYDTLLETAQRWAMSLFRNPWNPPLATPLNGVGKRDYCNN